MEPESALRIAQEALLLVLIMSAPAVLAAMLVGLVVSLFQAATQLQEQTLSIAPKIVAVYLVVLALGLILLQELIEFAVQLLDGIATVGR